MISKPKNLNEKSMNTRIQWLIVDILFLYTKTFILVAGFSFIFSALGVSENCSISKVALITTISFVLGWGIVFLGKILKNKKYEKVKELLDEEIQKLERQSKREYLAGKNKSIQKTVPVTFLGKTRFIIVDYKPVPDMTEEEIIETALEDTFKGLVITVRPESGQEEEAA